MNHLEHELKHLKAGMTEMLLLGQSQLVKSLDALFRMDKDLAREVLFNEKRVNALELKIDKDCENIFALFNPVANDLRFVFSSLKSNSNIERIADNAEGIAHYVLQTGSVFRPELLQQTSFAEMSDTVTGMMAGICEAYEQDDTQLARSMFEKDLRLNEINMAATGRIAAYIRQQPDDIEPALYLLTIIRKLERVGDLITNISEELIFYVEAKVLKHGKKTFRASDN
jgi:phosphate transport system protein